MVAGQDLLLNLFLLSLLALLVNYLLNLIDTSNKNLSSLLLALLVEQSSTNYSNINPDNIPRSLILNYRAMLRFPSLIVVYFKESSIYSGKGIPVVLPVGLGGRVPFQFNIFLLDYAVSSVGILLVGKINRPFGIIPQQQLTGNPGQQLYYY